MERTYTVGSLFAGIEGFGLGFERQGFKLKWSVEIEPQCRSVIARHFPDAKLYDDVRTVGQHNLERVDVLVGGFPCQGLSQAGLRKGLSDERSGLFFEMLRIADELKPTLMSSRGSPNRSCGSWSSTTSRR